MMDAIVGTMGSFMSKVAKWLTFPSVPWAKFTGYWNEIIDIVAPWNRIFPLTDIVAIIALVVAIALALMILYTVVLIKSFIPFSGGK